ncbi:hsp70 [Fusarium pseudoanthophilum]|uniref:Hsp70 n=1 Tax=Fusarium pseudoanthophilum TaxID=48495 RepID=A0A8H5URU8_9HYPO|nr:hsp70 [Fusarium pseudoanthophilum]
MEEQPDLAISVDLGTTFTGVAWMRHGIPIQVVNDWPGSDDRGDRKVPTTIVYNADGSISSWGFMCADDDHDTSKTRRDFFKIFLDPETLDAAQHQGLSNVPQSTAQARQFVTDYLKQIYAHIKDSIEMRMGIKHVGGWDSMAVLFLFSAPTTWTSMAIINTFKGAIHDAGFGTGGPKHSALVDLTESEAAAVATLKTGAISLKENSVFLTVDAGGGTTDLALMRATSTNSSFPQLSQVAAVSGVGVGSSLIDRAFARLVSQRMAANPDFKLPADFAARMARSQGFKSVKHKFGEKVYMQPVYKIMMEGVGYDVSHEGLGVQDGRMLFTKQDIQALFDVHIEAIMARIHKRLDWLTEKGLSKQVEYVILSGGLGSSAYVREVLQEHLTKLQHPNARNILVIPSQDPQLVVARGVLENKRQRMESGNKSVLSTWIARASYGVIVQEVYMPARHFDEEVRQDPWDPSVKWATNQIQWLIKKGDTVDPDSPLVKRFEIRLKDGDTTRAWDAEIVVSNNEAEWLPRSLKQAGVMRLCSVKSNLAGIEQHQLVLKEKRGTCFRRGHKFYICRFDIRVIVAPADLRFELWFGGTKFSGNHQPISVQWDAAKGEETR